MSNEIKVTDDLVTSCQICVTETKNLVPEQIIQQDPERRIDTNGKLVQFAWKMQQEGYTKGTARVSNGCLKSRVSHGADLADPTSVKNVLAK